MTLTTPTSNKLLVDTWYDRTSRNWITQIKDAEGNQVGSALFAGNRSSAIINHSDAVAIALSL